MIQRRCDYGKSYETGISMGLDDREADLLAGLELILQDAVEEIQNISDEE